MASWNRLLALVLTVKPETGRSRSTRPPATTTARRVVAIVGLLWLLVPFPGLAQTEDRLAELMRRIDALERELDELRAEAAELLAAAEEEAAPPPAAVEEEGAAASAAPAEAEEQEKRLPGPLVFGKNQNLTVKLSGRLHRMILGVDDGRGSDALFTDSEQGPTMLRVDVEGRPGERLGLGATLETGIRQNRPFLVSQDVPESDPSITVRIAEIFLDSSAAGKFTLGRGFAAAWLSPEVDLSATQFAALLPVGMLAPGLKFVDRGTGELSVIRVRDHFVDVERLLLVDRFRYDSPRFGGLQLSGTLAADSRWDVALRTRHRPAAWTIVGGASFQDEPFDGVEQRWDAAASLRHEPTGLNLTAAFSVDELTGGRESDSHIVKLGWLADLFPIGKTAFAADFYRVRDLRLPGDDATSFGVVGVQKWPSFGLDFYLGLRRYEIDRSDIDLEPLLVAPFGVVLNF